MGLGVRDALLGHTQVSIGFGIFFYPLWLRKQLPGDAVKETKTETTRVLSIRATSIHVLRNPCKTSMAVPTLIAKYLGSSLYLKLECCGLWIVTEDVLPRNGG
jgi:hypothetical protein